MNTTHTLLAMLMAAVPLTSAAAAQTAVSLYLIGDAGEPEPSGDAVLMALHAELSEQVTESVVVFLGDNIYPLGMPEESDPAHAEASQRLLDQVAVVQGTKARAIFIPGNHDWERGADGGWQAMRRQTTFIDSISDAAVEILPKDGCPGPEIVDVGSVLRLVLIDSQWWLHEGPRPGPAQCTPGTSEAVIAALRSAVADAGDRKVVVAAHHPLMSGGRHGGHYTWKEHIFPLTEAASWLWVPLPIIGSAYALVRGAGVSSQDMNSSEYTHLRESLTDALEQAGPPLIFAAGHEHNLQILRGPGARQHVISGSGIFDHATSVTELDETLFASDAGGYVRVDLDTDGAAHLTVVVVDEDATTQRAFDTWLDRP